jgi:hypothetical protein
MTEHLEERPFSTSNSILVTNTLLQFLPITLLSAALLFITSNDFVWALSLMALFGSMTTTTILVAAYEIDHENHGFYFPIRDHVNTLAMRSALSVVLALTIHACEITNHSLIRIASIVFSFMVFLRYAAVFILSKKDTS